MIDTATHTALGFVPVLGQAAGHAAIVMEPGGARIWLSTLANGQFLESIPVNSAGVPQVSTLHAPLAAPTAIYTAAVAQTAPAALAILQAKFGLLPARVWTLRLFNLSPAPVGNAHISALQITAVPATACTPVITTSMPVSFGSLGPGGSATAPIQINFSGCPINTKFNLSGTIGSGLGAKTFPIANNMSM
jgi:hypothetical protein